MSSSWPAIDRGLAQLAAALSHIWAIYVACGHHARAVSALVYIDDRTDGVTSGWTPIGCFAAACSDLRPTTVHVALFVLSS